MYTLSVQRDLIASHHLLTPDAGPEGVPHAHHYKVEIILKGTTLDQDGYLVDICLLNRVLNQMCGYFRDSVLNSRPEFKGMNPSIEHFARIFQQSLSQRIKVVGLAAIEVRIWEDQEAWASYTETP